MSLRKFNKSDARQIGEIIARSFADDPVNLWVFKHYPAIEFYYRQVARKLYLQRGFGHIMDNGSGASMWLPPATDKVIPAWQSLDIGLSMFWHGGLESIRNGMAMDECLLASMPQEDFFYLSAIGTLPEAQGQGVGSQLMSAGLERVDAAGMPAYLESSKESNVPFYQRFGFRVTAEVQPKAGAPKLWLMWRDART